MVLSRLNPFNSTTFRFINKNLFLSTIYQNKRCTITTQGNTKVEEKDDEDDQPVQYSTSPAATWAARHSQAGVNDDDTPWYQSHIVVISTISFLVYFGYLREPNDIDEIFDMELGDHFPHLSEEDLRKKFGTDFPMQKKEISVKS